MYNKIKENLFITLATIFLGLTLAFSFTAYGQTTSGQCEACGGDPDVSGDCYNVDVGAAYCFELAGGGCSQGGGSCENGDVEEN